MWAKRKYELVFLDIQLLELDGVQVGRRIKEQIGYDRISIVYFFFKEKVAATLKQFIKLSEAPKNKFNYHAGKSVYRLYLDEIYCLFYIT